MPPKRKLKIINEVISLTFGDQGENNVGMKKVGNIVSKGNGISKEDILKIINIFEINNYKCELYILNELCDIETEEAVVCVIRGGLNYILNKYGKNSKDLFKEMNTFEWDSKYYDTRRQKVLNKIARTNVCFGEESSEPDYENKKGRIVSYDKLYCLRLVKEELKNILGEKGEHLICEGNRYYDMKKCGIGWHGDAERRKVIAFRLGASMNLCFNWYYKCERIGDMLNITLNDGDMYIMSEKAVGTDWRSKNIPTLRHAAGPVDSKFIK